eukprot:10740151-Alexandrium_andersonii.AAC.1
MGWGVVMLSDVAFPANEIKEYVVHGRTWILIVQGKVAVAMGERWAERWRLSGAKVRCAKGADGRDDRVMVVSVG